MFRFSYAKFLLITGVLMQYMMKFGITTLTEIKQSCRDENDSQPDTIDFKCSAQEQVKITDVNLTTSTPVTTQNSVNDWICRNISTKENIKQLFHNCGDKEACGKLWEDYNSDDLRCSWNGTNYDVYCYNKEIIFTYECQERTGTSSPRRNESTEPSHQERETRRQWKRHFRKCEDKCSKEGWVASGWIVAFIFLIIIICLLLYIRNSKKKRKTNRCQRCTHFNDIKLECTGVRTNRADSMTSGTSVARSVRSTEVSQNPRTSSVYSLQHLAVQGVPNDYKLSADKLLLVPTTSNHNQSRPGIPTEQPKGNDGHFGIANPTFRDNTMEPTKRKSHLSAENARTKCDMQRKSNASSNIGWEDNNNYGDQEIIHTNDRSAADNQSNVDTRSDDMDLYEDIDETKFDTRSNNRRKEALCRRESSVRSIGSRPQMKVPTQDKQKQSEKEPGKTISKSKVSPLPDIPIISQDTDQKTKPELRSSSNGDVDEETYSYASERRRPTLTYTKGNYAYASVDDEEQDEQESSDKQNIVTTTPVNDNDLEKSPDLITKLEVPSEKPNLNQEQNENGNDREKIPKPLEKKEARIEHQENNKAGNKNNEVEILDATNSIKSSSDDKVSMEENLSQDAKVEVCSNIVKSEKDSSQHENLPGLTISDTTKKDSMEENLVQGAEIEVSSNIDK